MAEKFPEARIALCKCSTSKKIYGIRMERTSCGWDRTWAYAIKNFSEERDTANEKIMEGVIGTRPEYPGCPYCETYGLIVCGECGRLNCNNGKQRSFTCNWCGFTGELVGSEDNNHGDGKNSGRKPGFSFKSGNDR